MARNLNIQDEKLLEEEFQSVKTLNNFDSIIGVSQLNANETYIFGNKYNLPEMDFIIDPNDEFNKLNKLPSRYELVLKNGKIEELRKDPSLILMGCGFVFHIFWILGLFYLSLSFMHTYYRYKSNAMVEDDLLDASI